MFVTHELIKPDALQLRNYQNSIFKTAKDTDTLVCLPTGLGKTAIAILLVAERIKLFPSSKILVCAPTRPLVNQHYNTFLKFLNIDENEFQVITGTIQQKKREELYKTKKLLFATPQTIKNDIERRVLDLSDFSLLVLDEAHHAIGNYAYPFISKKYRQEAENPRILALTASPGGTKEKIDEICKNIGVETVEIRTEEDPDVVPYIKEKKIEWIYVKFPERFEKLRTYLSAAYEKKILTLKKLGFLRRRRISKKDLLSLQLNLVKAAKEGYKKAYIALPVVSHAIKIEHAIGLLETQGIKPLEKYFKKLLKEKSAQRLLKDKNMTNARFLSNKLFEEGARHPKIPELCRIINEQLKQKPDSKIIIFANYRDTVSDIVNVLKNIENAKPIEFIGQRAGLSQKEQIKRINDFTNGVYNILVCTSVGEEGIDIPEMELAIFYEAVPSAIRSIQRRGRVGRTKIGKVIMLLTKGTKDEAYYWASKHKERKMKTILKQFSKKNINIFDFK